MIRSLAASRSILIAIGVALVVGGAVALWGSRTPPTRVIATLPEAPGIIEGHGVEYRGVKVGSVEELRISNAAVVLTLRLHRPDLPLRSTDRVAVQIRGFGERSIAIIPSRHAGEAWQPGDTLQPLPPPETLDSARAAAARAIVDGAIQEIFARDSLERARRAAVPPR